MKKLFLALPFFLALSGSLIQAAEKSEFAHFNVDSEASSQFFAAFADNAEKLAEKDIGEVYKNAINLVKEMVGKNFANSLDDMVMEETDSLELVEMKSVLFSTMAEQMNTLTVKKTLKDKVSDLVDAATSLSAFWAAVEKAQVELDTVKSAREKAETKVASVGGAKGYLEKLKAEKEKEDAVLAQKEELISRVNKTANKPDPKLFPKKADAKTSKTKQKMPEFDQFVDQEDREEDREEDRGEEESRREGGKRQGSSLRHLEEEANQSDSEDSGKSKKR